MTEEIVISGYLFFECANCHHTVDWVNASSESEAWNIYIHEELGFQWDGTHYCEEWVESYNNLEEVLEDWRLSILDDGMVFREGYGNLNKTLEEVLKDLRFIQKSDGTSPQSEKNIQIEKAFLIVVCSSHGLLNVAQFQ